MSDRDEFRRTGGGGRKLPAVGDRLPTGPHHVVGEPQIQEVEGPHEGPRALSPAPSTHDVRALEALIRQVAAVTLAAPERQRETLDAAADIKASVVSIQASVESLRTRLETVENDAHETRLADVTKERDELKEARKHWTRYIVVVVVSLITGAVLMAIGRMLK